MKFYGRYIITSFLLLILIPAFGVKKPVGIWRMVRPVIPDTEVVKVIDKNGEFNVLWSLNKGETYIVKQFGKWDVISPGVVEEKCSMNNFGEVVLKYEVRKDSLFLEFSYPRSPWLVNRQIYVKDKTVFKGK